MYLNPQTFFHRPFDIPIRQTSLGRFPYRITPRFFGLGDVTDTASGMIGEGFDPSLVNMLVTAGATDLQLQSLWDNYEPGTQDFADAANEQLFLLTSGRQGRLTKPTIPATPSSPAQTQTPSAKPTTPYPNYGPVAPTPAVSTTPYVPLPYTPIPSSTPAQPASWLSKNIGLVVGGGGALFLLLLLTRGRR